MRPAETGRKRACFSKARSARDERWLLIGLSGRALARSAARSGGIVDVMDVYADADTCRWARSVQRVPATAYGFDAGLCAHLDRLLDRRSMKGIAGIVVGSGFEHDPALMCALERRLPILGSSVEAIRRVKRPSSLAALLAKLGVPHPPIRSRPEAAGAGWLVKRAGAAGGAHVRRWRPGGVLRNGEYLQRELYGRPCSAVFLADGRNGLFLGGNALYPLDVPGGDFRHGAIVAAVLPAARRQWAEIANAIVRETGLAGLCGLDGIVSDDGRLWIVEINPRPPASFELHERRVGLFRLHLDACRGRLPCRLPATVTGTRALGVIYAAREWRVPPRLRWPSGAADRPPPGRRIVPGQPVCTLFARGDTEAQARTDLAAGLAALCRRMERASVGILDPSRGASHTFDYPTDLEFGCRHYSRFRRNGGGGCPPGGGYGPVRFCSVNA